MQMTFQPKAVQSKAYRVQLVLGLGSLCGEGKAGEPEVNNLTRSMCGHMETPARRRQTDRTENITFLQSVV